MSVKAHEIGKQMKEEWASIDISDISPESYPDNNHPKMIVEYTGEGSRGKTHSACSWPKACLISTEGKGGIIAKKFGIPWYRPQNFDEVMKYVKVAMLDPKIESIVIDNIKDVLDWAELYVLRVLSEQRRKEVKSLYSKAGAVQYNLLYERMDWLLSFIKRNGKNCILTSRVKDEYINDTRTGHLIKDGYKKSHYICDLEIRFTEEINWKGKTYTDGTVVGRVMKNAYVRWGEHKPYLKDVTYPAILEAMEPVKQDTYMAEFISGGGGEDDW